VRRFLALDAARKRLLLQAFGVLASTRIALRRRSFKQVTSGLRVHRGEAACAPVAESALQRAEAVGWAVQAASRYTPWRSTCLLQVLAAQRMLQARSIPGAFCIGAAPGAGTSGESNLEAHAWLKVGERFITGEAGHQRYAVVSTFSWGQGACSKNFTNTSRFKGL